MRFFIITCILIFSLQSWTKANDIREFEIEGISIGDSLLYYFSEDEILKNIKWNYNDDKTNNKFVIVEFYNLNSLKHYHGLQFGIKNEDKTYEIYVIAGAIMFKNNIKDCYLKMKEIDNELSIIFKESVKQESKDEIYRGDKSGKSKLKSIYYFFDDGNKSTSRKANASIQCYDFDKDYSSSDNLRIGIRSSEFRDWYFSSLK